MKTIKKQRLKSENSIGLKLFFFSSQIMKNLVQGNEISCIIILKKKSLRLKSAFKKFWNKKEGKKFIEIWLSFSGFIIHSTVFRFFWVFSDRKLKKESCFLNSKLVLCKTFLKVLAVSFFYSFFLFLNGNLLANYCQKKFFKRKRLEKQKTKKKINWSSSEKTKLWEKNVHQTEIFDISRCMKKISKLFSSFIFLESRKTVELKIFFRELLLIKTKFYFIKKIFYSKSIKKNKKL